MDAAVGRLPSGRRRDSQSTWYSGIPASSTKSSESGSGFMTKRVPPLETGTPGSGSGRGAAGAAFGAGDGFCAACGGAMRGVLSRRMPNFFAFCPSDAAAGSDSPRCEPEVKSDLNASRVVCATNMSGEVTAIAACGDWNGAGRDQVQVFAASSQDVGSAADGGGTKPSAASRRTPLRSVRRTAGTPRAPAAADENRSRPTTSSAARRFAFFAPPPIVIVFVFVSCISIQSAL